MLSSGACSRRNVPTVFTSSSLVCHQVRRRFRFSTRPGRSLTRSLSAPARNESVNYSVTLRLISYNFIHFILSHNDEYY